MAARILIIEDNPGNLELMTYLLRAFGHEPMVIQDGQDALEMARLEKPDMIVCDIQLPTLDGYAVARNLKANPATREIPLVAVTALAMVGDRDKVLSAGFDGYISKPIEPESFVLQVESFLAAELRTAQAPRSDVTEARRPAAPATRGTILVVDDLDVHLDLKRSIFEPKGYAVVTATNVAGALALARQSPPDIILSDMSIAEDSGYALIKIVKADPQLRKIPFVFVTSTFRDEASRAKGLALGAARFLIRPIEPDVLLSEIEACLQPPPPPGAHQKLSSPPQKMVRSLIKLDATVLQNEEKPPR